MHTQPITRFEYKYRIGIGAYYKAVNALRPFCKLDGHSAVNPTNRYLVRSLYYDTPDYSAYTSKIWGEYQRDKFRIRCYENAPRPGLKVKVERKSRSGYLIHKLSDSIDLESYQSFISSGDWGGATGEALDEFAYRYYREHLKPLLVVEYKREAYFSVHTPGLRFSFDHDVRYAWTEDLFVDDSAFKPCIQNSIVFEIKCRENDPDWLADIVQELELVAEPNSKYTNAFEHTSQDVLF